MSSGIIRHTRNFYETIFKLALNKKRSQDAVIRSAHSVPREVFMQKRSQGEIFGIALMFVLIILGIIVYSQISKFSPDRDSQDANGLKYQLLAQTTLDTLMEMRTGCFVERNKDSVSDLLNYCISNDYGDGAEIECSDENLPVNSCEYSVSIIQDTLESLFENQNMQDSDKNNDIEAIIGEIPYTFSLELDYEGANLNGLILTEIGSLTEQENDLRKNELRNKRYQKAPSGIYVWESSYREVYVDLNLYYR